MCRYPAILILAQPHTRAHVTYYYCGPTGACVSVTMPDMGSSESEDEEDTFAEGHHEDDTADAVPWHSRHLLERRRIQRKLCESASVRSKIMDLWNVVELVKDQAGNIDANGYVDANVRFQKALNPPHTDAEALQGTVVLRDMFDASFSHGTLQVRQKIGLKIPETRRQCASMISSQRCWRSCCYGSWSQL